MPDALDDLSAGDAQPLLGHREFEQRKFSGSEFDLPPTAAHTALEAIQLEVVYAQDESSRARAAAK